MTASNTMRCFSDCCDSTAVAGTSMRISEILGTVWLAVSLVIVRLILCG